MLSQSMSILPESTMGVHVSRPGISTAIRARCHSAGCDESGEARCDPARRSQKENRVPDIFRNACTFPTQPSLSAIVRTTLSPNHVALELDRATPARSTSRSCNPRRQTWLKCLAGATYANRNLIVRDIVLAEQ